MTVSGYLDNGCYGDEKHSQFSNIPLIGKKNVPGRSIMDGSKNLRYLLPWKPICCHGNNKKGVIGGKSRGFLQLIRVNFPICNSITKYLFLQKPLVTMTTIPSVKTDLQMAIVMSIMSDSFGESAMTSGSYGESIMTPGSSIVIHFISWWIKWSLPRTSCHAPSDFTISSIFSGLKMPPLAPPGYKVYHYTTPGS